MSEYATTTHTGDAGTTYEPHKGVVSKAAPVICLFGELDELNSFLGLIRCHLPPDAYDDVRAVLHNIQSELFAIGSYICSYGLSHKPIIDAGYTAIEAAVARFDAETGPIAGFIIPGGHIAAGFANTARTVCRRTERSIVAFVESMPDPRTDMTPATRYINRLSTLLFAIYRVINHREHISEAML